MKYLVHCVTVYTSNHHAWNFPQWNTLVAQVFVWFLLLIYIQFCSMYKEVYHWMLNMWLKVCKQQLPPAQNFFSTNSSTCFNKIYHKQFMNYLYVQFWNCKLLTPNSSSPIPMSLTFSFWRRELSLLSSTAPSRHNHHPNLLMKKMTHVCSFQNEPRATSFNN